MYALTLLVLTHWPRLQINAPIGRPDLLAHLIAFSLWTVLLLATGWLGRPTSARAMLLAAVAGVCMSAVDEASQGLPRINRSVQASDLFANFGGVGIGIVLVAGFGFWKRATGRSAPASSEPARKDHTSEHAFLGHARTFAALTMGSRVLGLGRDAIIALVLGASAVASSFFTAFVIPNVFRRLFGEGALTAAFIPEYTRLTRDDPAAAARFASLTCATLAAGLGALVILAEIGLGIVLSTLETGSSSREVVVLTMVMLPFMPLVCVTALLGAMLQVHGRFAAQAGSPILLNAMLITAAASSGLILEWSLSQTAMALAVAVTTAGVLQLVWCLLDLRGIAGWTGETADAKPRLGKMLRRMIPVLIGLGTVQIGVLIDALIAGLPVILGTPEGEELVLSEGVVYPLDTASAAVLYFGQRLYQLPLGVFAVAIATAVFPALSRASETPALFVQTLRTGLRTSMLISIPSAVGLALVASPLIAAVYGATGEGGLSAESADRVRLVLLAYTPAIIAASITQVLTRAYYASDDMQTPMRIGIAIVVGNIGLNVLLIWPLGEAGLAVATSVTAWAQTAALLLFARSRITAMRTGTTTPAAIDARVLGSVGVTLCTTAAMALLVLGVGLVWPFEVEGRLGAAALLAAQVGIGAVAFISISMALGRSEVRSLLLGRSGQPRSS